MPCYRLITIVTGIADRDRAAVRCSTGRRLGVAMRAVVDNRDLAALNGVRPGRASQFAWALGTSMAAIAGIFLAEELSNLSIETLTLLIVDAFAAAIIGRLKSLPLTYVGGMIIGLVDRRSSRTSSPGRAAGARRRFAIPTIILFLALLFLPQDRIEGRRVTSTVTPRVPSHAARHRRDRWCCSASCSSRGDAGSGSASAASRLRRAHRVDHGVARPAHRLVGTDLARADHVRRRSARGRRSSSRPRAARCSGSSSSSRQPVGPARRGGGRGARSGC